MKKFLGIVVCVSVVSILGSVSFAKADGHHTFSPVDLSSTDSCLILKMDGERVPFPLRNANTKFELADGETYLLNGTLVLLSGKVFLNVDLVSQPWLATYKVVANPYFEISALDAVSVSHYSGRFVQVAVVADREPGANNHPEMKLNSILPPSSF